MSSPIIPVVSPVTAVVVEVQTTPNKKYSLHDLLNIMDRRDDSDVWESFTDDEPFDLGDLTREKIAGYHDIIEAFESDAERLKERAEVFRQMAKTQLNKAERIEKKLRFTMRRHESNRLPGIDYNAVVGKQKRLVIKDPRIDSDLFLRFNQFMTTVLSWKEPPSFEDAEAFPDKVNKTFKWDQDALRAAFKAGTVPDDLLAFASYDDTETFKWEVSRKI
jgi:hypothetical protein